VEQAAAAVRPETPAFGAGMESENDAPWSSSMGSSLERRKGRLAMLEVGSHSAAINALDVLFQVFADVLFQVFARAGLQEFCVRLIRAGC
jgi:hypothetical protein